MENMRRLVDDEVRERLILERFRRHVTGRFLAEPDQTWRIIGQQLGVDAGKVQVRQRPCRIIEAMRKNQPFDVMARHHDDGPFQSCEHEILFGTREQTADHGLDLGSGEPD